jgi:hypothetical protein
MPADVFLSYSHRDDVPEPRPGWVRDFHQRLVEQLTAVSGEIYEVWLDRHNHRQNNRTVEILSDAAAARCFVSIVSPLHVNSDWCQWELQAFLGLDPNHPVPTQRDVSFVFKVLKRPVAEVDMAPELRESGEFRFHDASPDPMTLHPEWNPEYHPKLNELVSRLAERLVARNPTKAVLFGDLAGRLAYDVRRGARKWTISPEKDTRWPVADGPRRSAVKEALASSSLAIFIPGLKPTPEFWDDLERARASAAVRTCMVWLPVGPEATNADEKLRALWANPGKKTELFGPNRSSADFVIAAREYLDFFDRHPREQNAEPCVHLFHRAEDAAIAVNLRDEARERHVALVDIEFSSLEELEDHTVDARAVLVAASKAERALPLMRRMAPLLSTAQRGAVGFPHGRSTLEGGFVWLGESVAGVFSKFPPQAAP